MAAAKLAEDLLDLNPNLLIVVEGLQYANDLTAIMAHPLSLTHANRLVYSAHYYSGLPFQFV